MEKRHFWEAYCRSADTVISPTVTAAGSLLPSWQKSATAPCSQYTNPPLHHVLGRRILHLPHNIATSRLTQAGRHHSCGSLSSGLCLHFQFLLCKSRNQQYDTITFIMCCTGGHAHIPPFILFVHPHSSRLQIWRQDRTVLKIQFLRSVTPCRWLSSCRHFGGLSCLRNVENCVPNNTVKHLNL